MAIERPVLVRPTKGAIVKVDIERPRRAPAGMVLPDFATLFEPDGETVAQFNDLADTGDLEGNVEAELGVALDVLLANKKGKNELYRIANDDEFWFAVCFQSKEQKDTFLELAGWAAIGDKYLDGLAVAKRLDVAIDPIPMPKPKLTRLTRKGV